MNLSCYIFKCGIATVWRCVFGGFFVLASERAGERQRHEGIGAGEMGKHGQKKPPTRQTSSVLEKIMQGAT